jgi:hypothetical protein
MDQRTVLDELREVLRTDISVINEQMIMQEYWMTCAKPLGVHQGPFSGPFSFSFLYLHLIGKKVCLYKFYTALYIMI